MAENQKKLGDILLAKKIISGEQLQKALEEQATTKEFLGEILLKNKLIKEKDLLAALSQQFAIACISLKDKYIDWALMKRFSTSLILDYQCLPIESGNQTVTIAITNPLDAWALKKSEEEAKSLKIIFVLVSREDMQEALTRYRQYMAGQITKLLG
jgi:hypothetical protein